MNVVIVEGHPGPLTPLQDALASVGHDVRVTKSLPDALAAFAKKKPDIAIVAWTPDTPLLSEVTASLRTPEDPTFRAVLAIVDVDSPGARRAAYEAGADDVAMISASPAELCDHVRSSERIVRLERRLRERVVELESALRRLALHASSRGQELAGPTKQPRGGLGFLLTSTWTALEEILLKTCGEFLQHSLEYVVGAADPLPGWPGAKVALADVGNELKLEVTFIASPPAAHAIAATLCGGPEAVDDDVVRDVLLELGNTGMGAVRAAFLGEEFGFAASIPEAIVSKEQDVLLKGAEAKRVLTFRGADGVVIHVIVTLRSQGRVRVVGGLLREGMVVATDILTDNGLLMVRAGTRLTETTALKLSRLFPKREIELAENT
ncbi:hypothetical protein AKJ09_00709 [Labilithrix luteola]|uniref:Response regulatory domain-containing protein n=1 Tax=Labilithrix luteola TaxID=1391654 RepID=A0A0K1PKJ2_9BACT|nr:chemotaxis protein CheX [Labilithrix luteola]AKU94045.1 hypothetical protein AKJ09_00709 [Labilithrix luteola]